jgi:hypothetical protein
MHREIRAAFQECYFEFLDEQPLAPHLRQRGIEDLVAARRHGHQFDPQGRMGGQQTGPDVVSLPEGKRAFPGGDTEGGNGHGTLAERDGGIVRQSRRFTAAATLAGAAYRALEIHQSRPQIAAQQTGQPGVYRVRHSPNPPLTRRYFHA